MLSYDAVAVTVDDESDESKIVSLLDQGDSFGVKLWLYVIHLPVNTLVTKFGLHEFLYLSSVSHEIVMN